MGIIILYSTWWMRMMITFDIVLIRFYSIPNGTGRSPVVQCCDKVLCHIGAIQFC